MIPLDFSAIDGIVEAYRQRGYYPSAVCQVFNESGTLYHRAVGDVQKDTWFDIASVSKIVLTTMLLFAMEEGKLSPDSLVLDILSPDGDATRERLAGVSVRQLMTHTSGLPAWFPFYTDGRDFFIVLERVLTEMPRETGYVYSDLNFMLLGLIFSRVTGLTLRDGLHAYIHTKMDIRDIEYGPVSPALCAPSCCGNQIEKRMCAERGLSFEGWRPDGVPVRGSCNDGNAHYYWHGASGHAGVFASSDALARLCRFYMTTDRPFFREAMDTMIDGRGLGFDKGVTYPEGCGHSGFTGTAIWFSRTHHIGCVLLTNKLFCPETHTPGNTNEFRRAVFYTLLGKTPPACV